MEQGIFTAEDFGFPPATDLAIEHTHCEGALTSTSLMVGASAVTAGVMRLILDCEDAVRREC